MDRRFGASLAVAAASLAIASQVGLAQAAELPPVKVSDSNKVAECATPGRLMAYVTGRNPKLDAKFEGIATEYMRQGEALGLRWDYAFFQMLVETGFLTFTGDVKPDQNNFAGLGATGHGARGESFKDVSTGARAHLQHLLMYTGDNVENPVAERTRNVQQWGVLTAWQKTIKGPMTFTQLAKQWAPSSRGYPNDLKSVADRFFNGPCKGEDPHPELMAEARKGLEGLAQPKTTEVANAVPPAAAVPPGKGVELARRAIETARAEGSANRTSLGAGSLAAAAAATNPTPAATQPIPSTSPPVKVLNPKPADAAPEKAGEAANIQTASVADAAKEAGKTGKTERPAAAKCRVWTASYGGAKAIIIKAPADQMINYTVLDVNEGTEKRETDAYINAYAKGGEAVGEFPSQSQALDKAFELCPEG